MSMTRTYRRSLALVAAAAIAAGCTATRTTKSAGEQIDDSTLTAHVKSALLADADTKGTSIDVETFRGTVQLNGFVDSAAMRDEAGRIARDVSGVTKVENNLKVQEGRRSAGEWIDDTVITGKVKAALAADPVVAAHQVNVEVREGVVQLAGYVDTSEQKSRAAEVARGVSGVRDVRNDLDVKP